MEKYINLAADCLLVFLAACVTALVWFDAEARPATSARDLASGTSSFLFILEQLHQQVKLGTAAQ